MPALFPRYSARVRTEITPTDEGSESGGGQVWVAVYITEAIFTVGWPTVSTTSRMVLGRFGVPVLRPIG